MHVSQTLYPYEPKWLRLSDGLRMHYIDEGRRDAPAILMLHGNPTWSFYWRRLVEALRAEYRVIAPDHIGCGKSDKPPDSAYSYRLSRRIEDIDHLVRHLDLKDVTLALHDWGGMIGMGWATQSPELVSKLVLLNTAAFPLPSTKALPASLWLARNTKLGGGACSRFQCVFHWRDAPGGYAAFTSKRDPSRALRTLRQLGQPPGHSTLCSRYPAA